MRTETAHLRQVRCCMGVIMLHGKQILLFPTPVQKRHLVWLLLRDFSSLDEQEQRTLGLIRQQSLVENLYQLAQSYVKLMRERDIEAFDPWLDRCVRCGIPDLESFAQGLQKDYEAVKTSFILPYSNGPVEGQVNRLKFVKRSMFGRGSFELLRQRFLQAA